MFERKGQIKKFIRKMNSRHPNIQLTCEEEANNKISFLNVSITRMNNKLVTSLYRKKTYSDHSVYVLITIRFTIKFNIQS